MNARKSIFNFISGMFSQIIAIFLGIMIPRMVIVHLGSEANGLLSSVNQLLIYLNLMESGVGTAALQSLYKAAAEENITNINRILAAVNGFYKKISYWYFFTTCVIALFFPLLIHSELSFTTICLIVLITGWTQAAGFAFQGTYCLLIQAVGQNYIITNIRTMLSVGTSVGKIVLLLLNCPLIALQLMYCVANVIQIIAIRYYIHQYFRWLNFHVVPDTQALSQKNAVLIHQISGLIFQNTDIILLTFACGLKAVSVYTMYSMLFGMIATAIATFNSSVSFAMGQTYHTNRPQFLRLYHAFETYNMALTFALYCTAHIFILPFLSIYTRGVTDINYLDPWLPSLMITTYLLSNGRAGSQRVIEYAGHFRLTQKQSVIESAVNMVISFICVFQFGLYGVLIGTIAALIYRTTEMIFYASKNLLKRSPWTTFKKWGSYAGLYIFCQLIFPKSVTDFAQMNYRFLLITAAISCIIILFVFLLLGSILDRESFYYCCRLIRRFRAHKKNNEIN